jgi:predicted ATP-grasp superfamily ATP-dependent carboligase
VLDAFADKLSFAEILDREGIPYPKIHRLLDGRLDEAQVADIRFPVLVKPRNLQAGNGIRMCETSSQVVEYLANQQDRSDFFIQEFVSGTDMTCSVFSNEGEILAHTIQRVILRSHKPFHPSAAVEFVHDEGVLNLIQKLIGAVRWSGIVSFDLVMDEETNEAKVLEANPRYWRSLLGSLMAGVNFPYVASLASEGRTISRPAYRNVRYAKPDVVATLMVKSLCGRPSRMSGVAVGSLQYLLRDPLPDVSIQLSRLREYFR